MKLKVMVVRVGRSMPMAAAVPVAVADPVAMTPMQVAVADQAAMPVVMPMAVAAMHLYQQVAIGHCGFGNGGLRRDGRRGGRSKQRGHSYNGCCQGHLHGFYLILAWRRPASLIRGRLCMPTLNLTATAGSSGIHGRASAKGGASRHSQEFFAVLANTVLRLDTPREHPHLNKP